METFNPLSLVVAEAILIGGFIWWDLREMSRRFERRHVQSFDCVVSDQSGEPGMVRGEHPARRGVIAESDTQVR